MSEATAKVENEQEVNPIEDLVKASIAQDYNKAGAIFGEVSLRILFWLHDYRLFKLLN